MAAQEPEFEDIISEPPSVIQPILMLAVIALGFWVISDWRTELEYFFSDEEVIELGDVTEFASKVQEDPTWKPDLPHNKLVSLSGLPIRRSQSYRYWYGRLVGSPIVIEVERDDADLTELEREVQKTNLGSVDRSYFSGVGRLIRLQDAPNSYRGLREYYGQRYGDVFCQDLTPQIEAELNARRKNSFITDWRKRYNDASPEVRRTEQLTATPTKEQVEEFLAGSTPCMDGYLFQDSRVPRSSWPFFMMTVFFLLVILANVVLFARWVKRYRAS